jgi:hypothetical protein
MLKRGCTPLFFYCFKKRGSYSLAQEANAFRAFYFEGKKQRAQRFCVGLLLMIEGVLAGQITRLRKIFF